MEALSGSGMTADLLREAGVALYGPRWQSDLARDLEVADRTVRRWDAGDYPIPARTWSDIRELMKDRRAMLASVRRKLPK
jgi:hypothetical protein